jgi:hypothetical protein
MEVGQTYPTLSMDKQGVDSDIWTKQFNQGMWSCLLGQINQYKTALSMQDMTQKILSSSDTNLIMDSKLSHNDLL